MLHRFNFATFSGSSYPIAEVSNNSEPEQAQAPSPQEAVGQEALELDLRVAVMACLCGGESRRWRVGELVERFKGLGICATKAAVTAALAELELELELAAWAPWRLVERGTEWILIPKSELLGLLAGTRKLPVKGPLSEAHQAVLLVVIGHRRKGGVSKTRIGEILNLDPSPLLDDLLKEELVYCDPSRELNFWRATQSALLALGLRSSSDIPALKELEEWFDSLIQGVPQPKSGSYFERAKSLHSRRRKRELERRESLTRAPGASPTSGSDLIAGEEGGSDLVRSEPTPLPQPTDTA
jgi:chromosome segregation and condensation protein ScpB